MSAAEHFWTDDRIDALKELFRAGNSARRIAEVMGAVSRSAVIGKLFRLGLSRGYITKANHRVAKPKRPRKPAPAVMRPLMIPAAVLRPDPAAPAPVDLPRADEALPESRLLSLFDLKPIHSGEGTCRWPLGDPMKPGFTFCGADCAPARVYCETHRLLSTGRGTHAERSLAKVATA